MTTTEQLQHYSPDDAPVRRREFDAFQAAVTGSISQLGGKIDQLVSARQVNWMFVLAALGVFGTGLGVGVKLLSESQAHGVLISDQGRAIDDFRSRLRGAETELDATRVEQETQNRWIADVLNLTTSYEETIRGARCATCDHEGRAATNIRHPSRDYWPLGAIGQAHVPGD